MSKEGIEIIYSYKNIFMVEIEPSVEQWLQDWINHKDFLIESGGILVGKPQLHHNRIIITDVTLPQPKDKGFPYRFIRNNEGHQQLMDRYWTESNHEKCYLGEWHTHRELVPTPSSIDRNNWNVIATRKHNTPRLIFLIIGTKGYKLWTIDNRSIFPLLPRTS